jgi:predicted transcriptional regulator of viral defense system
VILVVHRMDAELGSPLPDRRIAALAAQQYGVVSIAQLRRLGIGRGAATRRIAAGRIHRIHRGVYAVGHRVIPPEGKWMAAVLAVGRAAVLSHRSAAALCELLRTGREFRARPWREP